VPISKYVLFWLRLLPKFLGFSAADTMKMEAEKAPAFLADFGCNVDENSTVSQ
jgi:hypothetical protein